MNRTFWLLIGIILVLAVGFVVYYFWNKNRTNKLIEDLNTMDILPTPGGDTTITPG